MKVRRIVDKQTILHLRMADLLWERVEHDGFIYWAATFMRKSNIIKPRALYNTALATYLQFCKAHNIDTSHVQKKYIHHERR